MQTSDGQKHVLRTLKKYHKSSLCHTFSLEDQPSPNPSPLMGSNQFSLLPDLYNEHFGWSNGKEYITFIPFDGGSHGKGNWLLGVEPGVDSGYVFLGGTSASISPIDNDIDSKSPWKWLIEGKWEDQPQMRAYCLDEEPPANEYYEVEYYDPELTDEIQTSHLLPGFSDALLENTMGYVFSDLHTFDCTEQLILWLPNRGKYACVRPLEIIANFAQPMFIDHVKISVREMGVLTGVEHAQDNAWRLTFHLLGSTPVDSSASTSFTGMSTVDTTQSKPYRIEEYLIELQRDGTLRDGYTFTPLPAAQIHDQITQFHTTLRSVLPGEYFWMWQSIDENTDGSADDHDMGIKGKEQITSELFVKCIARSDNILFFQAYPTHRMELMTQTMTSKYLTYMLKINLHDFQIDDLEAETLPATLAGQAIQISSIMFLGKDVIGYLQEHLLYKDKKVNGMSSCFLYHAAVSFPAALVYAAELLCVFLGAKPVAMVQMHSLSEHQWKFPFVVELTQNAVKQIELARYNTTLSSLLPLDYKVFTYLHDETLVLYRKEHGVLMESIKPAMTAQALHPMPFPDEDNLITSWREQIYNAAWNGFVLGYPEHFVRSYCEDFSNGLDVEDKRGEYQQAKADVAKHLKKMIKKEKVEIAMGLTAPLTSEAMQMILSNL